MKRSKKEGGGYSDDAKVVNAQVNSLYDAICEWRLE